MLGNAVPSLLAEILANEIATQLLEVNTEQNPRLLKPPRGPHPRRERILPVPAKYRNLVGEHADHPGEGKGKRARARRETAT